MSGTTEKEKIFISMYIANEANSRDTIKQKIKSLTSKAINESQIKLNGEVDTDTVSKWLEEEFDKADRIEQGLAVFGDLDTKKVQIINLPQKPIEESTISDVIDLDQIVWMNTTVVPTIIILLKPDKAIFYWGDGTLTELFTKENDMVTTRQSRDNVGHASPAPTTSTFGTGTDKIQKDKEKALAEFLNQVIEEMKNKRKQLENAEMAVIVHTKIFSDVVDKFETEVKRAMPNFKEVARLTREIEDDKELKETIDQEVIAVRNRVKDEDYIKAKEEGYYNFAQGWSEVIESIRDQKVDTLFIKMNLCKEGYIDSQGLVYETKIDGSRKVKDISPWLIKNTMDNGGKVAVFPETNSLVENVAAKLRY